MYTSADVVLRNLADILGTTPDAAVGILVGFAVILITLVVYLATSRRSSKNVVAMLGLSGSGKTRAFVKIVGGRDAETYTSQNRNKETVVFNRRTTVDLVDIPGSEKVRGSLFGPYKALLRKLVFFVDSSSFAKTGKDVAEYLYDVLSDRSISVKVPLLIVCNKQDQPLAKSANAIRASLEKEFTMLTTTRAAALESTAGDASKNVLGSPGSDFSFTSYGRTVDFLETTVAKDTNAIAKWIAE